MKTDKPILKISFACERLTAIIYTIPFSLCGSDFSNFRMSPRLFSPDMESILLEQYEDVRVKASGSTLRVAEKYALIGTRIKFGMRSARRMIARLPLAQIRTMLILFAARGWVSTKLQQLCNHQSVSEESLMNCRTELQYLSTKAVSWKPDHSSFSLSKEHLKSLTELKRNKDIIITRPDKGRATVILGKRDYLEKMDHVLGDESKFLRLGPVPQFDRTIKIETELQH